MNIALIDDMEQETEELAKLLLLYRKENSLSFSIDRFRSGEEFLDKFEKSKYSIVFMDIYLDGMMGTETAELIKKMDPGCIIIFLSVSDDFMPQAFSCHAFDYLQKPPSRERIFRVMSDALQFLPREYKTLDFIFSRKPMQLLYSDIVCVVANRHNTDITDRHGTVYSPHVAFSEIIPPLEEDSRFLTINRGIIVNMDYIIDFDQKTCRLDGNIALPVRVREQLQLRQQWQDYVFASLRSKLQRGAFSNNAP